MCVWVTVVLYTSAVTVAIMVGVSSGAPRTADQLQPSEINSEAVENKNVVNNVWEFARISGPISPLGTLSQLSEVGAAAAGAGAGAATSFSGLSPCENAIASCCGANNLGRRASCFEILGCEGAWFGDLCRTELQREVYNEIAQGFTFNK